MLRSSREGRKRAAMYHAFPVNHHPTFTSRYTQKVGSVQQGRSSPSSQLQRTARATYTAAKHHHATIRSSSLRQAAFESDSDSEGSSAQTALDDAEDNNNSNSSYTTHTDPAIDESSTAAVGSDGRTELKRVVGDFHQRKMPSRDTTEEQSQSVSLSSSSPPTSHSEGDDANQDTRKRWHKSTGQLDEDAEDFSERGWRADSSRAHVRSVEEESVHQSTGRSEQIQSTSASPARCNEEEGEEEEEAEVAEEAEEEDEEEEEDMEGSARHSSPEKDVRIPREYSRTPRAIEGGSMIDNRGHRTKVKSLRMKEAEETLALSPKSRRKAEARSAGEQKPISSRSNEEEDDDDNEEGPNPSPTWSDYLARQRIEKAHHRIGQIEEPEVVPAKRGRGRPRGSNKENALERAKQKAMERKFSEPLISRGTLTSSVRIVTAGKATSEANRSTDSLALSTDSLFDSADSLLRRSSRRSNVAGGSTGAIDVVAKVGKPARSRASLPIFHTPEATEAPLRSPRVSRVDKQTVKNAGTEETLRVAGPSTEIAVADGSETGTKSTKALSKRKIYLTSGLYSDDYKKDEPKAVLRRKSAKDIPESLARGTSRTRKAHQVSALPLPIDYGLNLLEQQRDFRLPFSVAQEIDEIRGKLEAKKKPPHYKHIAQNQYFSRPRLDGELLICQCPSNGNCGESCMNRLTECLCHPKHCPCGDRCTNIYFGKRKAVKTEVQWYGARGFGLKTLEPIKKGGFIDEYRGEVIDFNEAVRRIRDHYKETGNYYFLMYDAPAGEMLDGGLKGNVTRFANHSCDPNCKVQKWLVCGTGEPLENEYQVALFAERDIEAGEELTYDYGWSAFAAKAVSGESNSATPEICHCGAANCSGFLGVKKSAATTASAVVSKVLKRAKKARKTAAAAAAAAGSNRSNSIGFSLLSTSESMPPPVVEPTSATKAFFASLRRSQPPSPTKAATHTAFPTKTMPSRVSTSGLMGKVLNGLFSPSSTLTSLSTLSDDDVSEMEKSADSTMGSFDSEPLRRRSSLVRQDSLPTERKRYSARASSPVQITNARLSGSKMQATSSSKAVSDYSATKSTSLPKGRILLKDRVIRVLVPNDEAEKEPEPNLIVEGKRERKMTLRAIEQDHDLYNRRRMRSSSGARGTSADSEAPATKKARRDTGVSSSPTPRTRLMSRATGP